MCRLNFLFLESMVPIVNINGTRIYDPSLILFILVMLQFFFNNLHSDNLANFTRFGVWSGVILTGFAETEKFWLTSLQKRCQSNFFCLDESSLDDIAICFFINMCLHRVCWGLLWVCFRSAFGSILNVNDSIEFSTKDLIGRRSDCSKRFVNYHMTSLSIRPDPMFTFRLCFWN